MAPRREELTWPNLLELSAYNDLQDSDRIRSDAGMASCAIIGWAPSPGNAPSPYTCSTYFKINTVPGNSTKFSTEFSIAPAHQLYFFGFQITVLLH